jgi:CheY-like chemotaxis protein
MTLDVLMPHMDGFDVLHRIKESPQIANLPVVIVRRHQRTAHQCEEVAQPLHLGELWFYHQAFDEEMLRSTIARALHPPTPPIT